MLATVNDVAGKFAPAERELRAEVEQGAEENEERAEGEEGAAEFAKWLHSRILPEATLSTRYSERYYYYIQALDNYVVIRYTVPLIKSRRALLTGRLKRSMARLPP